MAISCLGAPRATSRARPARNEAMAARNGLDAPRGLARVDRSIADGGLQQSQWRRGSGRSIAVSTPQPSPASPGALFQLTISSAKDGEIGGRQYVGHDTRQAGMAVPLMYQFVRDPPCYACCSPPWRLSRSVRQVGGG